MKALKHKYPLCIIYSESDKMSGTQIQPKKEKLYDFEDFEDFVEICEDEDDQDCHEIRALIYPKITQRVIDRVSQLTWGDVYFDPDKKMFMSKTFRKYDGHIAHGFNRAVRVAARYLAQRVANQQYRARGSILGVDIGFVVTIDLHDIDSDLRYEAWVFSNPCTL